jgi:hypothetical protein
MLVLSATAPLPHSTAEALAPSALALHPPRNRNHTAAAATASRTAGAAGS